MEMVAWLSGLTVPGEQITLASMHQAVQRLLADEAERGFQVSDVKVYGSPAMVDKVFNEDEVGKEVEGVGEVWTTEALDSLADFQILWQQERLIPAAPARRQRTRRR